MKINYIIALLFLAFISIVVIANLNDTNKIGGTELNGSGCVCHGLERDTSVIVWVEGPDTLQIGQTGYYRMYMFGGPAEGGGYNVAGRYGKMELVDSFSYRHPLALNELTQAFSLPFPTTLDTIFWNFGYTASDTSGEWDTIYSCGLSLVWDSIPDPLDKWNFGPKFPVKILDNITIISSNNTELDDYQLYQNYPNPFNPITTIRYQIPELSFVTIKIYDVLGNEIATLVNGERLVGEYEVIFDGTGLIHQTLPSGVYFYSLQAGNYIKIKKMVLIK
ncbi:MAG: T9SS type A sorting domain-containing protein [Bacteroidetes bacterium]|nr:T9SS type A sorting domain-containing protein [Bacteroidota bacterium]